MSPSSPTKAGKAPAPAPAEQSEAAKEAAKSGGAADAGSDEEQEQEDEEEEEEETAKKSKAEESSALEKLTDVVEEKQMDENKMKEAFLALRKQEEADKEAERKRCGRQLLAISYRTWHPAAATDARLCLRAQGEGAGGGQGPQGGRGTGRAGDGADFPAGGSQAARGRRRRCCVPQGARGLRRRHHVRVWLASAARHDTYRV
jgi:hypothetical protein